MPRYLRSTNLPLATLTFANSCMSCSMPQAPASGAASSISRRGRGRARRASRLAPEIIEVEPVIGGQAAIVLEPRGVALRQPVHRRAALQAAHLVGFGESLDVDLIA